MSNFRLSILFDANRFLACEQSCLSVAHGRDHHGKTTMATNVQLHDIFTLISDSYPKICFGYKIKFVKMSKSYVSYSQNSRNMYTYIFHSLLSTNTLSSFTVFRENAWFQSLYSATARKTKFATNSVLSEKAQTPPNNWQCAACCGELPRAFKEALFQNKYTGWAGQSWTIFCGPAAVAVGGCEQKD
jgi:hypothetical protein